MNKESLSPFLKSYLRLEKVTETLDELLPETSETVRNTMDDIWELLTNKKCDYLNNRSMKMEPEKVKIVLIGDPDSEELKTSESSFLDDLEELEKLDIKVQLVGKSGNMVDALCTDFAVQMLKGKWYIDHIEETVKNNE